MISQREADRRVFQRKQDALHKELREFVEERMNEALAEELGKPWWVR